MKKAVGGKKKKGKAFGNFGQSPFSVDDGKGINFEKALNTVKDIETKYTSQNTTDSKLTRKISTITQEKTLKTLQKSEFSWKDLSTNYISFIDSVYTKLKNLKENEPVRFDWTGIEHLTDAVFGHLLEKTKVAGYNYVLGIVLTGCCNLTDIGVRWMSQCFPKLKEVTLAGCLKVTETGIYSLVANCPGLKSLDLTATNVSILPSSLVGKDVDVPGCPLVSPSEAFLQKAEGLEVLNAPSYKKPDNKNMVKVCVIHPHGTTANMMSKITGDQAMKRGLAFTPQMYLKNTDIMANIIEFEEGMMNLFVSKRSVIIVPYEHDETKPLQDLVTRLFSIYCQVITKASKATVLFVALVKDANTKVNHHGAAFDQKTKSTKEKLIKQKQKLMQQKGTSDTPLTKLDQDNFTNTKELIELLETQAENVKFITVEKEGTKVNNSFIHEILLACEKTIKLYPEYEEIASNVYEYICSDASLKMFGSSTLTGALSLEGAAPSSARTLELLHYFGKLLYIDTINDPPLVMDIKWLSTFLSNLVPETNNGMFPYVSETTKVVSLLKADKKLVDSKLAEENSICLMPKIGVGMTTRNAYLGYGQLENDPPLSMDEFMGKKENVQEIFYKYILVSGLTADVMHELFSYASYVRKPVLMWQNGIVLQENLAQIVIQNKSSADNPRLELVVQSSNADTGNLKNFLPKVLVHSSKKMKIIIDYILSSRGIPFQIELQEKLSEKVKDIHGIVLDHQMYAREGGATLCKFCGTSSRQSNFLLELKRHIYMQDTSFTCNSDIKTDQAGENVIALGTELKSFENGTDLPGIKVLTLLDPYEQRDISFTALALDSEEDVKIELRTFYSNTVRLSYSFKTGDIVQEGQSKNIYQNDQLGRTVNIQMKPFFHGIRKLIQTKVTVNGEAVVQYHLPMNMYVPVIVPSPGSKPSKMKSVVMVHGHRNWKSGPGRNLQPGMRCEALDRKTPNLICVATVQEIYDDGTLLIHFDGWTDRYDYTCDPSTVDIHPVGWFEAQTRDPSTRQFMNKYERQLQAPKGYQYKFDWPSYCQRMDCLPVPFNFFSDEQKGVCTDQATNEVYEHVMTSVQDYKEAVSCSRTTIPGAYLENRMLSSQDSLTEELVGFFSNHRQFLFLLPEKFNVINLRFPSLISMMALDNQKVHFACSGHRMELLHLVDHGGLPIKHYLEGSEVDISHLYAYLEMIYMGLLVQPRVLPWELNKLCPGIDSSSEEQLELLEMGFKRIFFQYLLWSHAYNYSATTQPKKMDRSTVLPAKILRDEKSVKSLSSAFHIQSGSGVIRCEGHTMSVMPQSDMKTINSDQFKAYSQFMHKFEFQNNGIESLPDTFFTMFNVLSELNLSNNKLKSLPDGFTGLKNLEILDISVNELTALPKDFVAVKDTLENLNISTNPLGGIPPEVYMMTNLEELYANNLGNVNLRGIGQLASLEKLYIASNLILDFPEELCSLDQLTHLDISGLPWFPEFLEQKIQPNFSTFRTAVHSMMVFRDMTEEQIKEMFVKVDKDSNGIMDNDELQEINKIILEKYTRFGRGRLYYHDSAVSPVIWKLKSLKVLCLRFHAFNVIPDNIKELTALESLDVSHNPDLITLSAQLGGLPLTELHLVGCPSLRTPPKEIVSRGFSVVYGYLRRLMQGSVECKRTKLMVVGLGGAGKTSLIRAMTQQGYSAYSDYGEQITDGIDITTWELDVSNYSKEKGSKISYSVWDFAGQTVYYNTHQFFLSNRACYLLLWNIRLGYEHAGLDFWLSSIACHAPKAPILVVGTHCDKVEKSRIPTKDLKATYPQIAGFHFVSSYSGEGIKELREELGAVTLKQKYMGERIPEAWLSLEKHVLEKRKKEDLIPFKEVKAMGNQVGILEESELIQAVQFLHDLGSLQFFNTEFLRSLVVIVPQWIVDVMACVVTVHVGPIQEGKLLHKDMAVVWEKYPKDLHPWLLRLTEEFDLTFPLADEEANLVPCLLPDAEKDFYWPTVDMDSDIKETRAIYNFKYLPAGLFNRAQVRLHQYSESGQLWKKGMYLKKNNHIAVIRQKGQCQLELKAQGFKPENILFLVDEVISTLITESYSGVYYDLMVPCLECQNLGMSDPSMFSSSKIHRAVELNAPFVQCDTMFHVLSIPELKSLMPPNKTTEFDEHLRRSVMELKDLGDDVNIRVIFCYSKKNIPDLQQENKLVHPGRIMEDLRKDGFDVSICDNPESADVESLTIAFKSAQVILFGVSDEFCADDTCKKLLIFAKETLNKPILLVTLGSSLKFLETSIGLNIADEVFVKMTDAARYDPKIIELKEALKKKKSKGVAEDVPKCFLSYCWSNSHDAISKGSNKLDGALGFGDPRKIAQVIQDNKIVCWLDIERVGNAGLFDDIAEGLRKAKVMVACVSDEYANSRNCKMEFRFAVAKLKIPTILAVVGTGYNWESSEIGMLAVGSKCPKINFQIENEAGFLQVLQEIKKYVDIEEQQNAEETTEERKKNAFKEIIESTERQFLRNLMKFKERSFTADYPRLVVINLFDKEKKRKEEEERQQAEIMQQRTDGKEEEKSTTSSKKTEDREANYCFSLMCENEEGWHDVRQTIPFPEFPNNEEEEEYLAVAAPYAARINLILKYTGQQMAVMTTPAGKQLQEKLESHANTVTSEDEIDKAYISIIKDIIGLDENHTYGGLKKTTLLNGKSLWLCDKHREQVSSITEQRYRTQLKPTELEEEETKNEKTTVEVPSTKVSQSPEQTQSTAAASSLKVPEQPKNTLFKTRTTTKSPLKRQTSQACSVM